MRWYERAEARISRIARPLYVDTAIFVLFAVACVSSMYTNDLSPGVRAPTVLDATLAVIANAPIIVRRRWPLGALLASLITVLVLIGSNGADGTVAFTIAFLTFTVGAYAPLQRALVGLAAMVITLTLLGVFDSPGLDATGVAQFTALFALLWAGGVALRARRDSADRAVRLATARAESEAQRSAHAVAEERLRIAQDLHDVVAHSISIIAVQAGVGTHFIDSDIEETRDALEAIGRTSRSTLGELRRLLGVLRDDGDHTRAPAPTLAELPRLIDDIRDVGLPVTLDVHGTPAGDHLAIEMSAYRIVQEALTNVIKHAGPTTNVTVRVDHRPTGLEINVDDDGRGAGVSANSATMPSGRHGLIGMRERVEVWGGDLIAGPRPGGGYAVTATFPFEAAQ